MKPSGKDRYHDGRKQKIIPLCLSLACGVFLPAVHFLTLSVLALSEPSTSFFKSAVLLTTATLSLILGVALIKDKRCIALDLKASIGIYLPLAIISGLLGAILLGHFSSQMVNFLIRKFELSDLLGFIFHPVYVNSHSYPISLIFMALIIPTLEEIWYRELSFQLALCAMSLTAAIGLSALLFSFSHISAASDLRSFVISSPSFFFTGLVLACLRIRFGLVAAIIGHSMQNYFALRLQKAHLELSNATLLVATLFLTIVFSISLIKARPRKPKSAAA